EGIGVDVGHGKPLAFGKDRRRGRRLKQGRIALEVVELGDGGPEAAGVLLHDETDQMLATLLASLQPPLPVAIGVLYCDPAVSYERQVVGERAPAPVTGDIDALLRQGHTWTVE